MADAKVVIIDTLNRENALNLQQILNLEDLLYETRILDKDDGSPCWCTMDHHDSMCWKAREATKRLWSK